VICGIAILLNLIWRAGGAINVTQVQVKGNVYMFSLVKSKRLLLDGNSLALNKKITALLLLV